METVSFDLYVLGLADSRVETRRALIRAVAVLGALEHREAEARLGASDAPLFQGLDRERAQELVDKLREAGAKVEVRPVVGRPPAAVAPGPVQRCPSCGLEQPAENDECAGCGLVFAKREREQVRAMRRTRLSEEAALKAGQVREEWVRRAKAHLARFPLAKGAVEPFARFLRDGDVPFLRLDSDEGPVLLTTLRLLGVRDGKQLSCPYELMADVDVGGGLVLRRGAVRLQLRFCGELPWDGKAVRQLSWRLVRESAEFASVVMDWVFARSFMCESCGTGELQYRLERSEVHGRCTRCAADHAVDLEEALLIPLSP